MTWNFEFQCRVKFHRALKFSCVHTFFDAEILKNCYNKADFSKKSLFLGMANGLLGFCVRDWILPATFQKCEKFTSSPTADFWDSWLVVKADQFRRQIDQVRFNRSKLKCFHVFFTKCFQCHIIRCFSIKAPPRSWIDMKI